MRVRWVASWRVLLRGCLLQWQAAVSTLKRGVTRAETERQIGNCSCVRQGAPQGIMRV